MSGSSEEWFDEDAKPPEDSEYRRTHEAIWKEGYKNAVMENKDASLQKGFEDGFSRCADLSARLGELRGNLEAALKFGTPNPDNRLSIQTLLAELNEFSSKGSKFAVKDVQSSDESQFQKQADVHVLNMEHAVSDMIRRGTALLHSCRKSGNC